MDDHHLKQVLRYIREGSLVPFLGAGVNVSGREGAFELGRCLPDGGELAEYLARHFDYPGQERDLVRVSQFVSVMEGNGELYAKLHTVFDSDYPPSPVHRFLALVARLCRERGWPQQTILTTNYDDAIEQAFRDEDQPYDLVFYVAEGPDRGRFCHVSSEGARRTIDVPNEYAGLPLMDRAVIVKLHGAVDRRDPDGDSYVISEDDYIDYLVGNDLKSPLPKQLAAKLKRSHIGFLGYSLRDWNLRVILHQIWESKHLGHASFCVQRAPSDVDRRFWRRHEVEMVAADLVEYVTRLETKLQGAMAEVAS